MFASTPEKALETMVNFVKMFKELPQEEQDHLGKYHLGSVFLDCPICGHKGVRL